MHFFVFAAICWFPGSSLRSGRASTVFVFRIPGFPGGGSRLSRATDLRSGGASIVVVFRVPGGGRIATYSSSKPRNRYIPLLQAQESLHTAPASPGIATYSCPSPGIATNSSSKHRNRYIQLLQAQESLHTAPPSPGIATYSSSKPRNLHIQLLQAQESLHTAIRWCLECLRVSRSRGGGSLGGVAVAASQRTTILRSGGLNCLRVSRFGRQLQPRSCEVSSSEARPFSAAVFWTRFCREVGETTPYIYLTGIAERLLGCPKAG